MEREKIKKRLAKYYSGEKAREYDHQRSKDIRDRDILDRETEIVEKFLSHSKEGKILDIACGTGRIFPFYRKREIFGVDISKDMLKIAKKKNPESHLKIGDAENLPFRSDSFPVVITSRFICHTPEYIKVIKEMTRVTKKGGSLIIDFPNKHSLSFFTTQFRILKGKTKYYSFFTYSDIKKIAKENNLEIAEIEGKAVISAKIFPKKMHRFIKILNNLFVIIFRRLSYPLYVRFIKK